ncbi:cytochrome c, partial [bacterium]|nr:cytochrome c [bacterium]
ERKLNKIAPSFVNVIRDAPGLDFFDPMKKVRQRVLDNIKDDYYFAQVRKVDRCETCHLAADRKDFKGQLVHVAGRGIVAVAGAKAATTGNGFDLTFEDGHKEFVDRTNVLGDPVRIEAPFQSHPDLDTYVASGSHHPVEKFGCTVCHLGEGQSVSFVTAAHTPDHEEQRHDWYKHHKWDVREHWNEPQFPKRYVQAACLLCHPNNRPVPGADKLNFGRETWERLSCVGCHKMKGFEDEPKRGPDLRRIDKKLTKSWVAYWVENPQRFRPKTNMPRFFHLDVPTPEERDAAKKEGVYDYEAREAVEIRAITEFLFAKAAEVAKEEAARGDEFVLPKWTKGDAARGKVLFTARGCVGCHKIDKIDDDSLRTYAPDEFGPNLYNAGHKVKPEWIQAWVMNPKHYWVETRMPNLRIPEDEARDLATYLTEGEGVRDASLDELKELAPLGEEQRKQLKRACQDFLEKDFTSEDIALIFANKDATKPKLQDEAAQLQYLGEQSVGRYGCFGCHYVRGMESRPGIGRELSDIGDKNLTQVDWGFESVKRDAENKPASKIREVRHEWLHLKVERPRIFDKGKVRLPLDRSRMPEFKTTRFEREALVTYLLGHTGNRRVPDEYKYRPAVRRANVIEGEYAIQRNNCKACHLLGVDRVALRKAIEDEKGEPAAGPVIEQPVLDPKTGEPAKSPITGQPVMTKAFVEAHVLFDNVGSYWESDGAAVIQLYANGPKGTPLEKKGPGQLLSVGVRDPSFATIDEVRSPLVGAEADLEKVLAEMPEDVWLTEDKKPADDPALRKKEIETIEEKKAQQLAAIRAGSGPRNRGGTALDKLIQARVVAKLGYNPWDTSPANKDQFAKKGPPNLELEDSKTFGPPHLLGEGRKVQPLWLQSFLKNPVEIRPSLQPFKEWEDRKVAPSALFAGGPHMPTYGFRDGEAQVFSRYFAAVDEERRLELVRPILDAIQKKVKAKEGEPEWEPGYQARLDIQKKVMDALEKFDVREYFNVTIVDRVFNFSSRGDVSLSRAVEEKTSAYMAAREAGPAGTPARGGPGWYAAAYRLYTHPDVNCQKCHLVRGQVPAGTVDALAPDLDRVRERLRPEYLQEWIENPKGLIPGTKMTQLFVKGSLKTNIWPVNDASVHVSAIVDWLLAGSPLVLETFPKVAKAGGDVRVTSDLVNLDAVTKIDMSDPDGRNARTLLEGAAFSRERSAERTTALRVQLVQSDRGKTYLLTVRDGRYVATTEVSVSND